MNIRITFTEHFHLRDELSGFIYFLLQESKQEEICMVKIDSNGVKLSPQINHIKLPAILDNKDIYESALTLVRGYYAAKMKEKAYTWVEVERNS